MIRSKLFASAVMLVFLVTMLLPGNLLVFGAEAAREKSGAEIFLKWFTIGAVAVGAAVGFASFGAAGLLLGLWPVPVLRRLPVYSFRQIRLTSGVPFLTRHRNTITAMRLAWRSR